MVIFHSYVKLPESKPQSHTKSYKTAKMMKVCCKPSHDKPTQYQPANKAQAKRNTQGYSRKQLHRRNLHVAVMEQNACGTKANFNGYHDSNTHAHVGVLINWLFNYVQLQDFTTDHWHILYSTLYRKKKLIETRTNKKNTFQSVTRLLESTIIYQYHIVYPYTL